MDDVTLDELTFDTSSVWPSPSEGYAYELGSSFLNATDNDQGSNWCRVAGSSAAVYYQSGSVTEHGTPGSSAGCTP